MKESSNPVLREDFFTAKSTGIISGQAMTIGGTLNKAFLLTLLVAMAGAFSWSQVAAAKGSNALIFLYGGVIAGLVVALITTFKREWSPFTAPVYAAVEGIFLGALSFLFEMRFPGIALQATLSTVCTLLSMLFLYQTKIIQVTDKFRSILFAATAGIALLYLSSFILGFFNIQIPFIHQSGTVGIAFSVFVVIIAALNLLLDFDFIERMSSSGAAPKYMEWYGAFGLMVTLIWLYVEFLRLLSKLRDRR